MNTIQTYGPTMDGDMALDDGDEWVMFSDCEALVSRADVMQELYNAVIEYTLNGADVDGDCFLRLWQEGDWDSIATEFPTFKHLDESRSGGSK